VEIGGPDKEDERAEGASGKKRKRGSDDEGVVNTQEHIHVGTEQAWQYYAFLVLKDEEGLKPEQLTLRALHTLQDKLYIKTLMMQDFEFDKLENQPSLNTWDRYSKALKTVLCQGVVGVSYVTDDGSSNNLNLTFTYTSTTSTSPSPTHLRFEFTFTLLEVQEEDKSTQQFKFHLDVLKAKEESEQKLKEAEDRMDMKSCREEDEQALRKENEEQEKQAAIDKQEMRKHIARPRTGAKIPRVLGKESEDEDAA